MRDVLDIHTHTVASGHAYNTIYEMVQSASNMGLELLGISDHGPAMEGSACKHYFRSNRCLQREIMGVKILFGCELNILDFDGRVDLDETFAAALDYGIASLHDVCIDPGTRLENTRAYVKAMDNPKVHVIGHPDDGTYAVDFDELAQQAAKHKVLIELNEASVRPGSYRKSGRENASTLLKLCERYGTKVLVSSDAHVESDIRRHRYALELLESLRFPEELVVNRSVEALMEAFKEKNELFGK